VARAGTRSAGRRAALEIAGIEVWDGERALGLASVRWHDDRIEAVSAASADAHPGLSLIPGLVDSHVHMVAYAGSAAVDERTWGLTASWTEQMLHGAGQGMRALENGVTTVRDLGAFEPPVALRRAIDQGALPGPRVVAFGHVGMTAGHGDLMWPPDVAVRPETADGPDACRHLVRRYARAGADGIKIFTSGGVMSLGDKAEWRNQTPAEIGATVDEAHALGMPVAAHAHTQSGIQSALDAGVDSLEHATLITPDQAAQAREQGCVLCPTLLALRRIAAGGDHLPAESVAKARRLAEARGDAMRRAAAAGVRFVLGTDGGGSDLPFGSQYEELRAMAAELGLTAEEALVAATSAAARTVGLGERTGRIEAGLAPDFLVVRGQPWRDLTGFGPGSVVAVVARGRVVAGSLPT
jgi:imidazolonepropionase-like amidohydrolase